MKTCVRQLPSKKECKHRSTILNILAIGLLVEDQDGAPYQALYGYKLFKESTAKVVIYHMTMKEN